jgi:hypothetical protein
LREAIDFSPPARYIHLMRYLSLFLIPLLSLPLSAETPDPIRDLFNDRIRLNRQYKEDYTEPVRDHPLSARLVPLAQQNGDDWVALLTYLRDHGDARIQFLMLRTELLAEIIPHLLEEEDAETEAEKETVAAKRKPFETQLQQLEATQPNGGLPESGKPPRTAADAALPLKLLAEFGLIYLEDHQSGYAWVDEYEQKEKLRERVKQENLDWIALFRAVIESGDPNLMYLFLRTQLQGDLYSLLSDLPGGQVPEEQEWLREEAEHVEKQLKDLQAWWESRKQTPLSPGAEAETTGDP